MLILGYLFIATKNFNYCNAIASSQFNLNPTQVGLMFLIGPGVYTFVAPVCGMIADKSVRSFVLYRNIFIIAFRLFQFLIC